MKIKQTNQEFLSIPSVTRSDYAFLISMRIPTNELFDCRRQWAKRLSPEMKAREKLSALTPLPALHTAPQSELGQAIVYYAIPDSPTPFDFSKTFTKPFLNIASGSHIPCFIRRYSFDGVNWDMRITETLRDLYEKGKCSI